MVDLKYWEELFKKYALKRPEDERPELKPWIRIKPQKPLSAKGAKK